LIDPVFNTSCTPGCTLPSCSCENLGPNDVDVCWSSTTYVITPGNAYTVRYDSGLVQQFDKTIINTFRVRAVRGGS
jgi:hypothetical protein